MILWLIDLFIDLFVTRNWFILLYDMHVIILCLIANIRFHWSKPVHHSGTFFASSIHSIILFWVIFIWYHARLINCYDCFILLIETHFRDLEWCYSPYRTFLISNLTLESDPVFGDHLFQNKKSHLGFSFLFYLPFKNKTKISGDFKSIFFNQLNHFFQIKIKFVIEWKLMSRNAGSTLNFII